MMDDILNGGMSDFDAVWQRVTGQCDGDGGDRETPVCDRPAGPEKAPEDGLLLLIHDETCAGACAAALSRSFPADGRAVLQRIAAGSRRRLRRLRAEWFIATGVAGGGNEDCGRPAGKLASLRAVYLQLGALAEGYGDASEKTPDPDLREAFSDFADQARCAAREVRALLIESF